MLYDVLTPPADIIVSSCAISRGSEFTVSSFCSSLRLPRSSTPRRQAPHMPAADSEKGTCYEPPLPSGRLRPTPFLEGVWPFKGESRSSLAAHAAPCDDATALIEVPRGYSPLRGLHSSRVQPACQTWGPFQICRFPAVGRGRPLSLHPQKRANRVADQIVADPY